MSGPFRREGLEGMAAFLAGAGLGAALARRLPETGRGLAGIVGIAGVARGNLSDTGRAAPVAASLGRMQALLGEIRGLMGTRAVGAAAPVPPGGEARAVPAAPSGPDRSEMGGIFPVDRDSGGDVWRKPDRIGYGRGGAADGTGLLALFAAAIGAATAGAAIRKGGAAAAWPALAGFLAACAWAAWSVRSRPAEGGRREFRAARRGQKGRSGRAAMP